mmetsp:Transcript_110988/g.312927  ORF Transcript_110988/g.312927 Transcript_110988/m.312927 type:complete len:212 (-) Transcript_110988:149-784(-)
MDSTGCPLQRCQGSSGCICPKADCESCGRSERVRATGRHFCSDCLAEQKAARAASPLASTAIRSRTSKSTSPSGPSSRGDGVGKKMRMEVLSKLRVLDAHADGSIEVELVADVLQGLEWTEDDISTSLTTLRVSGNGCASFEDFIEWAIETLAPRSRAIFFDLVFRMIQFPEVRAKEKERVAAGDRWAKAMEARRPFVHKEFRPEREWKQI